MIDSLPARYYDGCSAAARSVRLRLEVDARHEARLIVEGPEPVLNVPLASLELEASVGRAHAPIALPDGSTLELLDPGAFASAVAALGHRPRGAWLQALEGRLAWAVGALAVVVLLGWSLLHFVVPALADRAVALIPASIDRELGTGGLELLDRGVFRRSQLPLGRQRALRRAFAEVATTLNVNPAPTLEFRGGGVLGPNAFALPAGIVVLTDELAAIAEHDDELRAVFAHEIGHVQGRHALRVMLRNSASALLMVGLLGDAGAASALLAGVPTALVHASYSRSFEREADDVAREWMAAAGVPTSRLRDLLARIEAAAGGDREGSFFDTHPPLEER